MHSYHHLYPLLILGQALPFLKYFAFGISLELESVLSIGSSRVCKVYSTSLSSTLSIDDLYLFIAMVLFVVGNFLYLSHFTNP